MILPEYHIRIEHITPARDPGPDSIIGPFWGAAEVLDFCKRNFFHNPLVRVIEGETPQGEMTMTAAEADAYLASRL
jgi:hypothetical protein